MRDPARVCARGGANGLEHVRARLAVEFVERSEQGAQLLDGRARSPGARESPTRPVSASSSMISAIDISILRLRLPPRPGGPSSQKQRSAGMRRLRWVMTFRAAYFSDVNTNLGEQVRGHGEFYSLAVRAVVNAGSAPLHGALPN
jgi:hypothetical protein